MTLAKTAKIAKAGKENRKNSEQENLDVGSLVLLGGLGDLGERIFRKSG